MRLFLLNNFIGRHFENQRLGLVAPPQRSLRVAPPTI